MLHLHSIATLQRLQLQSFGERSDLVQVLVF